MNTPTPERREGAVDLASNGIRVRAGFRVVTGELLAGGPIELEFFVESRGAFPLRIVVSGDRMRQRPGQFSFAAMFDGLPLEDPMAIAPYMGGPQGDAQVSPGSPWHQPLLLNQFVRLEHTQERLARGGPGRLDLACRRPLALGAVDSAFLSEDGAEVLAVDLAFDLRRDDPALAALVARLFDEIMQGPPSVRERPLTELISMRSAARAQIEALTRHPDPSVAERARQALAISV